MRFLVVVPTIRQSRTGFELVIRRLRASLTQPTDLHVLDGVAGKAQTLNEAYESLLLPSKAEVYVSMDDDVVMPVGWQNSLTEGFDTNPNWGALGLYLGDHYRAYMGLADGVEPQTMNGIEFYAVDHVVGCLVAFRRRVAIGVGPIPQSPQRYQYWEDAWRGAKVRELGYECAYLCAPDLRPTLYSYDDPPEYLASKRADVEASRPHVPDYLSIPAVGKRGAGV